MRYPDLQYIIPFPIEMHRTDELSSCDNYWVKNRNVAVGYVWTLVYVRRTEPKIQKHRCENLRNWQIETPVHQTAECPPNKIINATNITLLLPTKSQLFKLPKHIIYTIHDRQIFFKFSMRNSTFVSFGTQHGCPTCTALTFQNISSNMLIHF
jgi:hypothetical protein